MPRRKKSKQRTLVFDGLKKSETLSRVTSIQLDCTDKEFVYFDKQADGTWALAFTSKTIESVEKLRGLLIKPKAEEGG